MDEGRARGSKKEQCEVAAGSASKVYWSTWEGVRRLSCREPEKKCGVARLGPPVRFRGGRLTKKGLAVTNENNLEWPSERFKKGRCTLALAIFSKIGRWIVPLSVQNLGNVGARKKKVN